MPYRAIEKTIDLNVLHNHIASGISRLRADDDELMSIFASVSVPEQEKIRDWFSSDECDIQMGWGFVIDPEVVPAIHAVIQNESVKEKFIGNMSPLDLGEDSTDVPTDAWNFGRSILIEIAYDRSAYAYYLYEIVKHILLIAEESMAATYAWKNIMMQGGGRIPVPRPQGGGYLFVYSVQLSFDCLEMIADVTDLDTIESVVISQEQGVYQLTENEEDYR